MRARLPAMLVLAAMAPLAPALAARGSPAAAYAAAPAGPAFDASIASAKAAMLADPAKAHRIAGTALATAERMPAGEARRLAIATAQWLIGESLSRLDRPRESLATLTAALGTVLADARGSKLHGDLLMSQGQVAVNTGRVQTALASFQHAYKIFAKAGERRSQAVALQNIGSIYTLAGDYKRVLRYYSQSAETYGGDAALALSAHNNIGMAYRELGDFARAAHEYRDALALAESMRSPVLKARVLSNLASAQILAGDLTRADATAAAGLRIAESGEAREWAPFLWGVRGQVAFRRGDPAGAAQLIGRTFAGADLAETGPVFRDFHDTAQQVYDATGEHALALAHLRALKRIDDEAREVRASTNAALMSAEFDFSNQELKISRLQTGQLQRDVLLARSSARLNTIILAALLVVLALVVAGFFSIRRSRNQTQDANRDLSLANTALEKALKAKSEFLATTSHEIRTPLNGILGMTQVLLRDVRLDKEARDRVQVVHGAGEMMKAVVDDILDMARIESGRVEIEREELDLPALLQSVGGLWADQAAAKGVPVLLEIDAAPARILGDGRRLRQVVFNLMSNATKFTDEGKVALTVEVAARDGCDWLVIRVRDSGIGIAPDQQAAIFTPFQQVDGGTSRRFGGTGLGLAISRHLAEAMGGTLTVESALGAGSTFTVMLPLERCDDPPLAGGWDGTSPTSLEACAILVIEPNPFLQSMVRAALDGGVGQILFADDVAAGMGILQQQRVALVVLDEPTLDSDGADGRAVEDLRAAAPGARFLLLATATGGSDASPAARGIDHVAAKTFPPIDLAAAIATALGFSAEQPHEPYGRIAA